MTMLRNAFILLLAAAPASAEGLPEFNLNALHAKDLLRRDRNRELAAAMRDYDMIPNAPQPVFVRMDGGPVPELPGPEVYQVYDPFPGPSLPPPLSKAGYVLLTSSTRLKIDREKGELTVTFPEAQFSGWAFGGTEELFVKVTPGRTSPRISWAAVLCSRGSYLGYKGGTVTFPSRSGSYSLKETLALGSPKGGISRTHRWLTAGMMTLDDLCSDDFRKKMKDARAETLPPRIGAYSFEFNPDTNTLKAKW